MLYTKGIDPSVKTFRSLTDGIDHRWKKFDLKKQAMGKSNWQGKALNLREKGKTLTLCSNLELAVEDDVVIDVDVDEWEPRLLITDPCDSVTVSKYCIKPGKRGLNSRLKPILQGGGVGSHTLPNHVTGNGWSTRYSRWVIKPTRRTAKNFLFPHK